MSDTVSRAKELDWALCLLSRGPCLGSQEGMATLLLICESVLVFEAHFTVWASSKHGCFGGWYRCDYHAFRSMYEPP